MSSSRSSTANSSSSHNPPSTQRTTRASARRDSLASSSPLSSVSSSSVDASATSPPATTGSSSKKRSRTYRDAYADAQSSSLASTAAAAAASSSSSQTLAKGKGRVADEPPPNKKARRTTIATSTPASYSPPSAADVKGKGRAQISSSPSLSPPPALTAEEEAAELAALQQQSPPATRKRAYSLRSSTSTTLAASQAAPTSTSTRRGKGRAVAVPEFKKPLPPKKMPRKARPSTGSKDKKPAASASAGSTRVSKGNSSTGSSRAGKHLYGDDDDDDDVMMSGDDYQASTDDDSAASRAAKPTGASDEQSGGGPAAAGASSEAGASGTGGALARALANAGVSGSGATSLDALRAMYDSFGFPGGGGGPGSAAAANRFAESLAQSMFADSYGGGGGLFGRPSGGQQTRMRTMLAGLRSKSMSTQLGALQEASEFLSISTEDTLSGYFDLDGFIKEFIRILKGEPYVAPGGAAATVPPSAAAASAKDDGDAQPHRSDGEEHDSDDDDDDSDDDDEGASGGEAGLASGPGAHDFGGDMMDDDEFEDAELMRILALSAQEARQAEQAAAGGAAPATDGSGAVPTVPASFGLMAEEPSADKLEAQLLACRCLANLMEALPGSAHTVVAHGAVPVLCAKLLEIQYIDLAEQTLSTMEKISQEYPLAIIREGGLGALLNYLDFFSTNVQRTAVTAAANCCRNVSQDHFQMVRDVFPMLRNVLAYPDQRLVEQASLAVLRAVESYRHKPEFLETLLDVDMVRAINSLLMPAAGATLLSPATYTHMLRALSGAAKVSAKVTVAFLEAGMVDTIYQILTGVVPGAHEADEQGASEAGQGLGGGLKDMVVLQNLAHRPKDQIEETLSLICELLPPLSKDGVFDPRSYTEKALARLVKAKAKAQRAAARAQAAVADPAAPDTPSGLESPVTGTAEDRPAVSAANSTDDVGMVASSSANAVDDVLSASTRSRNKEADQALDQRLNLLKEHPELVRRFIGLIIPVLVDVYAATVALKVRTKVLTALLKTVGYLAPEELREVLQTVPLASLLGSIMSSRDNPALTLGTLQLIELLSNKLPEVYKTGFRREGVMFEVEALADEELTSAKASKRSAAATPSSSLTPATTAVIKSEPQEAPSLATLSSLLDAAATRGAEADAAAGAVNGAPRRASAGAGIGSLFPPPATAAPAGGSASKRLSSLPLDPKDANILRARVLRFHAETESAEAGQEDAAARSLKHMQDLVGRLNNEDAGEDELRSVMAELAALFTGTDGGVSSFELLKGGLVDGLLECSTINGKASAVIRRRLLFEVFSKTESDAGGSPFAVLVKRLQESLSRMETFEVTTAYAGSAADDSRRSSTALLARQIRLKLVAEEGSDVPKACQAMVVSIQAIATLQALNDYLRPRLTAPPPGSAGRLPGMYAAYAAASDLLASARSQQALSSSETDQASGNAGSAPSSSTGVNAPAESPAADQKPLTRRRSARLSGKGPEGSATAGEQPEGASSSGVAGAVGSGAATDGELGTPPPPSATLAQMALALGMGDIDDGYDSEDGYSDEYDEGMFDGEMDDLPRPAEKTVDVTVTEDGSKVVAQTPNGSRVETPVQAAEANSEAGPSRGAAEGGARGSSYATALKTSPTDWHLEFSMNGQQLPLETTVYGAIHRHESTTGITNGVQRGIWSGIYPIQFKKVAGPAPTGDANKTPEPSTRDPSSATAVPDSVPANSAQAKILRLLRVLHALNADARSTSLTPATLVGEAAFVNNKLTAKLGRQLEEPMILASSCLPDWASELPRIFPFLFPFETRFSFLNLTSFGYARLIQKWQSQQERGNDHRTEDALGFLSRLPRQKVRISRNHLLESAVKVFELYGTTSSILEIEYFEEVGTGLGPTLEFYAIASKEFGRRDLRLWRDADSAGTSEYVHRPQGFFPAPAAKDDEVFIGTTRVKFFRILGQFVAKALLDSRIIDMAFNPVFLRHVLGDEVIPSIQLLRLVDVRSAKSLDLVQQFADAKRSIVFDDEATEAEKRAAFDDVTVGGVAIGDLSLDFTLLGSDIELKAGGGDLAVDMGNVEEYIELVLDWTLAKGIQAQVNAFRAGFSTIFPVNDLRAFSPDELVVLFGSADEDWSAETLAEVLKADHGYNSESGSIANLIEVMSAYDAEERREYLQFVTGAPKLPIGGFRGLNPPLTVVRKGHEAPFKADDYLPSVMTCVNYLKLPDYSTREVLADKLRTAMKEGGHAFHLS